MAAPSVSLYVPTPSATRMSPCPVHAAIDLGEVEKSIVNSSYSWSSVNSGTTATYQVNADNLDGDETADDTTAQSFTDVWVDIYSNSSSATRTNGILIFPGVTIPSGKAIISATIEMYAGGTGRLLCTVSGEDVDSAANLTTTADINGRTTTTANVSWDTGGPITNNAWLESPNLATVLQEIYDRTGSLSSANVAFILEASSGFNALARFNSYANSEGTEFAAKLNIEYADSPLLNEYTLDTPLASLTKSGDTPTNIVVNENGSPMSEGTVGSLAAGEWGVSGGELYVRLSDDADPDSKADDYLDISFDVSSTGDSSRWEQCRILWNTSAGAIATGYGTCTDPRPGLDSKSIDLAGRTDTDNHNRPNGFNFGWVFGEGTHTITATVTNPSGDTTTETSGNIVVAADSRTAYTVQASGGDYTTLAAALTARATTSDVKITIEDGHTENITAALTTITGDNFWITQAGTGTKPVITYSDATDSGNVNILATSGVENFLLEGVRFAESTGNVWGSGGTLFLDAISFNGTCGAVVGCGTNGDGATVGIQSFVKGAGVDGLLIQNCDTEPTESYSVISGTTAGNVTHELFCVVGNDFGFSRGESTIRTLEYSRLWNILWTKCTGDESKSCIRWAAMRWGNQYGCYLIDGDNWCGSAVSTQPEGVLGLRIDGNYATGAVSAAGLMAGIIEYVTGVTACNNIVVSDTNAQLSLGNTNSNTTSNVKHYINLLHNTIVGSDTYSDDSIVGGTTNGQSDHANNRVAANLFVHDDPADMTGYFADIGSGIADFDNNVWPATQTNLLAFARIYSGATPDRTSADLAAWNAETWVGTDTERDVTLDAAYRDSSPTTVTTESGVYDDYYGNPRGATSYAGATIAAVEEEEEEEEETTNGLVRDITREMTRDITRSM